MIYEYDGTFFGFLSAVFDGYYDGVQQITAITASPERDLFSDTKTVYTDSHKASRILEALKGQCGHKACHYLYYGFMAEEENREDTLLWYIRLAFRYKGDFLHHLSEEPIWKVRQMARKTSNERHKLLGLVRFRELSGGLLYAPIAPTCCVVPLMASHFAARLSQEAWVIHDVRRGFAVLYDTKELSLVEVCGRKYDLELSRDEKALESLWQRYYETIAIPDRRNEDLRRSFMPKKYWPYLIEDSYHS